jgi:ElaB/YqjD/DUF883 family membrane-anchored ribosome-binding protein
MLDEQLKAVRADTELLMRDAQNLFHEAKSLSGERADALRAQGAAMLDSALTQVQQIQTKAVEKSKALATSTNTYVHDHPWQAVGVAAVVGTLVGLLIARK